MSDSKQKVQEALEQIKDVFSQYKIQHPVEGSPVSVTEEMQYKLEHDTYNTLPLFLMKATVWGGENDFKAFLPMILEIYAFDITHLWSSDSLFRIMRYNRFETWKSEEQTVIHVYCRALWDYLLDEKENFWRVREFIRDVFQPESYLQVWESRLNEIPVFIHLIEFIITEYAILDTGFNAVGVSDVHNKWIIADTMLKRLEAAYFQYIDEPFSKDISQAVEHIKWLLWNREETKSTS